MSQDEQVIETGVDVSESFTGAESANFLETTVIQDQTWKAIDEYAEKHRKRADEEGIGRNRDSLAFGCAAAHLG